MKHSIDPAAATHRSGSERLSLRHGQTLQLWLREGSEVHLRCGSVELQEPAGWLAEQVWQPRLTLSAGQSHAVARSGWATLYAPGGAADLLIQAPVGAVPRPPTAAAWRNAFLLLSRAGRGRTGE